MVNEDNFDREVDEILNELRDMLLRKHSDYGEENLKVHGLYGILVRMDDKMARLSNLIGKEHDPKVDESISDTFRDIAGYSVQALRMLGNGELDESDDA